jgi:cytochrome c oxidase subunit 1
MFFWFPKMFARRLNESLGKLHFWLTFAGVYCVFMPMHWLGLMAHSRIPGGDFSTAVPPDASLRAFVTVAAILTAAAQILFVLNFVWSLRRGEKTEDRNPWRAATLEWSVPSPPPIDNFGACDPIVYRGAYGFGASGATTDFEPQNVAPAPSERASKWKQPAEASAKES